MTAVTICSDFEATKNKISHCLHRLPIYLPSWDITATICVLTPTVQTTSHAFLVWHHTRHICGIVSTMQDIHPHFMTSNHRVYVITAPIFDILSTVSVSSHPLYWWYHTNCNSEITSAIVHNIISIVYDMTPTVWHHNHCFHGIRFPAYHITSRIYDMSSPIAVTSQKLCCEYM